MITSARSFLANYYGSELVSNLPETDVVVGTSVVKLVTQDPARIGLALSNNGSANVAFSSKPQVTATTGIPLTPGQTVSLQVLTDFDLTSCDLYAISSGSGNSVHVVSTQLIGDE